MKPTCVLYTLTAVLALAGCSDGRQGKVRDLSDAIAHCREYSDKVLPNDVEISLDQFSTRQSREFYDVFLNAETRTKRTYVHCRITMSGYIDLYDTPGLRRKGGGAFSQF